MAIRPFTSLRREQTLRVFTFGIRFFLTAALTASQTPGPYAPFALGSVAAAGGGAQGAAAFAGAGWELLSTSDSAPMYLPADDPKVRVLSRIYQEITGRDGTPYTTGGGTYARHLKNAVGFGMEGAWETGLPQGHGGVHEPDEALPLDALTEALKISLLSVLEVDAILHS